MGAASATESYLLDFHHRHPGATAQIVGKAAVEVGGRCWPSSYAWLADQVPRRNPSADGSMAVLDLACGSGEVLRLLAERDQPGLTLIGVDLSPSELSVSSMLTRRELGDDGTPALPPVPEESGGPDFDNPAGRQASDNEPVEASTQGGADA